MSARAAYTEKQRIRRKNRLIKCVAYLQRKGVIRTYEDISEAVGMKPVTVRGALSLASPYLSDHFLNNFIEAYADYFHPEWLLEGKGKMLRAIPKVQQPRMAHRWERIAYVMEQEKMDVKSFAGAVGMNAGSSIYRILSDKAHPLDRTMERIHRGFPQYRLEWLLEGTGEILDEAYIRAKQNHLEQGNATSYQVTGTKVFPIIPDAAAAGALSGYGDYDPDAFQTMTLPVDRAYKGNYYIFTVRGASMDDGSVNAIVDGDRLLCREVQRVYWNDGLHFRTWPYFVIVTKDEGIIVKAITDQDLVNETIRCHSLNPDFPDIIIPLKDVIGIYNVVELVSRSMKI